MLKTAARRAQLKPQCLGTFGLQDLGLPGIWSCAQTGERVSASDLGVTQALPLSQWIKTSCDWSTRTTSAKSHFHPKKANIGSSTCGPCLGASHSASAGLMCRRHGGPPDGGMRVPMKRKNCFFSSSKEYPNATVAVFSILSPIVLYMSVF